jgi:hypothetical protein
VDEGFLGRDDSECKGSGKQRARRFRDNGVSTECGQLEVVEGVLGQECRQEEGKVMNDHAGHLKSFFLGCGGVLDIFECVAEETEQYFTM